MNKKYYIQMVLALAFLIPLVACTPEIPLEKQCSIDSDCVPSACCHPKDAVNKAYAPDCEGMYCTMSCEPGTLDCDGGEIRCVEGECQAILLDGGVQNEIVT